MGLRNPVERDEIATAVLKMSARDRSLNQLALLANVVFTKTWKFFQMAL
jgi:hypothetical protein